MKISFHSSGNTLQTNTDNLTSVIFVYIEQYIPCEFNLHFSLFLEVYISSREVKKTQSDKFDRKVHTLTEINHFPEALVSGRTVDY